MRGHSASGTGGNVAVMTPSPAAVADSSATPPHPPQAADTVSGRAGTIAVVVVLVAAFMDLLDATIVSVAAPAIQTSLHASGSALQWMVAGYTLALGASLITGGRIGDQYGRRKIFLIGLIGFILASTLCALAGSAGVLIAMRILQGLAGGLMVPQVFGIIRSSFAPAARPRRSAPTAPSWVWPPSPARCWVACWSMPTCSGWAGGPSSGSTSPSV